MIKLDGLMDKKEEIFNEFKREKFIIEYGKWIRSNGVKQLGGNNVFPEENVEDTNNFKEKIKIGCIK